MTATLIFCCGIQKKKKDGECNEIGIPAKKRDASTTKCHVPRLFSAVFLALANCLSLKKKEFLFTYAHLYSVLPVSG
jgi:hypothetical protein